MALLLQLSSPSCQGENLDVLSVLTFQLGLGDVLATAGRKRLPHITHLVLHLLSLLLFQAETHARYLYKHSISALYQVHLHCAWRGAQKLLSKSQTCRLYRERTWECGKDLVCPVLIWRHPCGCPGAGGLKAQCICIYPGTAVLKPGSTASETHSLAATVAPVPVTHFSFTP